MEIMVTCSAEARRALRLRRELDGAGRALMGNRGSERAMEDALRLISRAEGGGKGALDT